MIRRLDRYLLKSFLINYAVSLFVLISLYVVLDLLVNMDEFTEKGRSPLRVVVQIADYYFFNLPLFYTQLSGIITLFAACVTLARLQRNNEITAILASGTSLYRVAAPILLAGVAMNALLLLDREVVLPGIAAKVARERDDVEGERVYAVWCLKDGEGRLLSAQRFSPRERKIGGLIVIEKSTAPSAKGQLESIITADIAEWSGQRGGWVLTSQGRRIGGLSRLDAGLGDIPALRPETWEFYPSTLTPEELVLRKSTQWLDLLSLGQLRALADRGDLDPVSVAKVRHSRVASPLGNMVLLILGISFFMNRLPGSVLTQGAKALIVCSVAFLAIFVSQEVDTSALAVPLALPFWLPLFIFGPVAAVLLYGVKT